MSRPAYSAPAVEGALSLLETPAAVHRMGATDLAKKLGLSKRSVFWVLAS